MQVTDVGNQSAEGSASAGIGNQQQVAGSARTSQKSSTQSDCRVPYLNNDAFKEKGGVIAEAVLARRHGNLLNLDRVVMHSAPIANAWCVL